MSTPLIPGTPQSESQSSQPPSAVATSSGAEALAAAFPDDEVWVVAPDREQSASSHSISLHRPLRLVEVGPRRFAVDGTPTDAVVPGAQPRAAGTGAPTWWCPGVNHGPNLANDVLYSGHGGGGDGGRPARVPRRRGLAGRAAAAPASSTPRASRRRWRARWCALDPPAPVLLNVNVPAGPVRGYRFVAARAGAPTATRWSRTRTRAAASTTGLAARGRSTRTCRTRLQLRLPGRPRLGDAAPPRLEPRRAAVGDEELDAGRLPQGAVALMARLAGARGAARSPLAACAHRRRRRRRCHPLRSPRPSRTSSPTWWAWSTW